MKSKSTFFGGVLLLFLLLASASIIKADHTWGNYHWARTSNPFGLRVVDSNTPDWDDNLRGAMTDWSQSSVLDLFLDSADDSLRTRKRCPMVSGKIRSCNAEYGFNGWLGLASINASGNHITQGTSKMNDSYFNGSRYNETNRQHVMCQEIGHDFGLGHTSEDGSDQNTCMDYSNDLGNPRPNAHDYDLLDNFIYKHLDTTTTIGFAAPADSGVDVDEDPRSWGRLVHQTRNGRGSTYERENHNGSRTITHVFWTQEAAARCQGCDHRFHDH